MRNSSDRSSNWGKIFFNVDVMSLIEGLCFPQTIKRNKFSFESTVQIRLINFRFSHDSIQRMVTDFVSTTGNDTLNSSFFCSRVSGYLPIMGILELL